MEKPRKLEFIISIEGTICGLPLGFSIGDVGDEGSVVYGFLRDDKGCSLKKMLEAFQIMFNSNCNLSSNNNFDIAIVSADFLHTKDKLSMQAQCDFLLPDNIFFSDSKVSSKLSYNKTSSNTNLEISGKSDFIERSFDFCCAYDAGGGATLTAKYEGAEDVLNFSYLANKLKGITIPECFSVKIKSALFQYMSVKKYSHLALHSSIGNLFLYIGVGDNDATVLGYKTADKITFSNIPIVGEVLKDISLKDISFNISSADIEGFQKLDTTTNKVNIPKGLSFIATLQLSNYNIPIAFGKFKVPKRGNEVYSIAANDDEPGEPQGYWCKVDKSLGPVLIKRIGIDMQDSGFHIMFDGSLTLCGIGVSLLGAGLAFTPMDFSSIRPRLLGLGVNINRKPLTISGAFMTTEKPRWACSGFIALQYKKIGFTLLGEYTKTAEGAHSIFCFGALRASIGGPPCFFIIGLAGGLGINRNLKIPNIYDLEKFPLMAAATGAMQADEALKKIKDYISPQTNAYWLAVGVSFTTFNVIKGFLFATVRFGSYLEIHILGIFELSIPTNMEKGKAVAYAKFLIDISYSEDSGVFSIQGVLDSDSYVITKECHLTGGFVVITWFSGEHKGDFVVSFGGYSSKYTPPAHYPSPAPIGFNWQITNELSAKGSIFFALTPSCVMAGGRLEIVYSWGKLRAWLIAFADFLIQWKPYHYDIDLSVSLGVSYRIDFLFIHTTLTLELGASLHIWGPEFSGIATIHLWFISFDIRFGSCDNNVPPSLNWHEFSTSFLPAGDVKSNAAKGKFIVISSSIEKKSEEYVFNQNNINMQIKSSIPLSLVKLNKSECGRDESRLGVAPMGNNVNLSSVLDINISYISDNILSSDSLFKAVIIKDNVPAALWDRQKPDSYSNKVINDVLTGVEIILARQESHFFPYAVNLWDLTSGVERKLNAAGYGIDYKLSQSDESISIIRKSLDGKYIERKNIANKLAALGLIADANFSNLSKLSKSLNETFSGSPNLAYRLRG